MKLDEKPFFLSEHELKELHDFGDVNGDGINLEELEDSEETLELEVFDDSELEELTRQKVSEILLSKEKNIEAIDELTVLDEIFEIDSREKELIDVSLGKEEKDAIVGYLIEKGDLELTQNNKEDIDVLTNEYNIYYKDGKQLVNKRGDILLDDFRLTAVGETNKYKLSISFLAVDESIYFDFDKDYLISA